MRIYDRFFFIYYLSCCQIFALECYEIPEANEESYSLESDITYTEKIYFGPQKLDYYKNHFSNNTPLVILIHGGGFQGGSKSSSYYKGLSMQFVSLGYSVANFDYPLTGYNDRSLSRDEDVVYKFGAAIKSIRCGIRYLISRENDLGFDSSRMVIAGFSAGGNLAEMIGNYDFSLNSKYPLDAKGCEYKNTPIQKFKAVIAVAAVSDLTDENILYRDKNDYYLNYLGTDNLKKRETKSRNASPIYKVHKGSPAHFLIHNVEDPIIPSDHTLRMHNALSDVGVEHFYYELGGTTHSMPFFGSNQSISSQTESTCKLKRFLNRIRHAKNPMF